jgi:hypothetical protein
MKLTFAQLSNLECKENKLTELTAHIDIFFVKAFIDLTATMHAPHPPSWHIAFVPLKLA